MILNEFLNHLIARNHIIFEVEKDGSGFAYEFLKENVPNRILFLPGKKELERYSSDNDIYILHAISETPNDEKNKHGVCLEKIIVDLFSNKTLKQFISKSEYPHILEEMFSKYRINESKLFRYVFRRGKKQEIIRFILENTNIKLPSNITENNDD